MALTAAVDRDISLRMDLLCDADDGPQPLAPTARKTALASNSPAPDPTPALIAALIAMTDYAQQVVVNATKENAYGSINDLDRFLDQAIELSIAALSAVANSAEKCPTSCHTELPNRPFYSIDIENEMRDILRRPKRL